MTEREMQCMGQIRCFSRPITFWSPFIKKVLQKNRGKFHSRQSGDRLFIPVAKPKFTVANGDHWVANVEPCKLVLFQRWSCDKNNSRGTLLRWKLHVSILILVIAFVVHI